jgi:hypothetical protein
MHFNDRITHDLIEAAVPGGLRGPELQVPGDARVLPQQGADSMKYRFGLILVQHIIRDNFSSQVNRQTCI